MAARRIEELDKNFKAKEKTEKALRWYRLPQKKFQLKGLAWQDETDGRFMRLPLRAKENVTGAVWDLAQCTAGACVHFRTNSTAMSVRGANDITVLSAHMPATGSRGMMLYCGEPFNVRPWRTAIPDVDELEYERVLFENLEPAMREFRLYLPLYRRLEKLEIGLDAGAKILAPSAPAFKNPLVFYGTSITQGGCASTAGSDYVSAIGRKLNMDVVNLGFSGNGKGEPELAELISEIDASMYILDYAANTTPKILRKTLPKFYSILREKRPDTPIMFISKISYWLEFYNPDTAKHNHELRMIMMDNYVKLRRKGDEKLFYVDGLGLVPYGADGVQVDGCHPTDHGFMMMADNLAPHIRHALYREV